MAARKPTVVPNAFVGPLAPNQYRGQFPAGPADPRTQGPVTPEFPLLGGVYSDRANPAASTTSLQSIPSDPFEEALKAFQQAAGSAGGAAAAAPVDYGTKTLPDGRTFNLNDAGQRLAYNNALKDSLAQQRDQLFSQLDDAFKAGNKQAVSQYQQYISQIDQNISDIQSQAKQYAADYDQTLSDFNAGKQSGDISRQNYFATISPNAFQSSQATSQQAANDQYLKGLTDLTTQANDTVGLDYLNDPSKGINAFAPGSQFGRQVSSINQQRQGLQDSFNSYNQGALADLRTNQSKVGQQFNDSVAANTSSLGQIDLKQGGNPFQYGVQSVQPFQAPAPDLSKYSAYTDFNQLANPAAPGSSYVKPVQASNAFTQPQISQYLNRTNTSLTPSMQNDWFNKYIMGKATG